MKSNEKVNTKLGLVHQNNKGYYKTSDNELLHRKIWEKFYGQKIPKGYVIHHRDFNPTKQFYTESSTHDNGRTSFIAS